ncbi:MAG: hypothetical protein AAF235_05290 [Planctomycetota bacterium]
MAPEASTTKTTDRAAVAASTPPKLGRGLDTWTADVGGRRLTIGRGEAAALGGVGAGKAALPASAIAFSRDRDSSGEAVSGGVVRDGAGDWSGDGTGREGGSGVTVDATEDSGTGPVARGASMTTIDARRVRGSSRRVTVTVMTAMSARSPACTTSVTTVGSTPRDQIRRRKSGARVKASGIIVLVVVILVVVIATLEESAVERKRAAA